MATDTPEKESRGITWLIVLAGLSAVRLWILPLGKSFWIDETVTVSIVREHLSAIGPRAFQSLQSVLFSYLEWGVAQIFGSHEVAMRLLSVAASILGAYVFYRIAARLAGREAGIIAACLFVAFPQIADEAADARPYALGLCFEALALAALIEWTRARRMKSAVRFAVCAALAIHCHWFFVLALLPEAVYAAWKFGWPDRTLWGQIAVCCLCGAALLAPLVPQIPLLRAASTILSFSGAPSLITFLVFAIPVYLVIGCAVVWALAWAQKSFRPPNTELLAIGLLFFAPAAGGFLVSKFTSIQMFTPRYLAATTPGVLLLWTWVLAGIQPAWVRHASLAGGLTLCALSNGGFSVVPNIHSEDWRTAAARAPRADRTLLYSGFVPTQRLDLIEDPGQWSGLAAPVAIYRPDLSAENTSLIPFNFGDSERDYVRGLLASFSGVKTITVILRGNFAEIERGRFWGIARDNDFSGPNWAKWLVSNLEQSGFRHASFARYGDVEVDAFDRPGGP